MAKKKNITLDDLAVKMDKSFENVSVRFESIDLKFKATNTKIDNLAEKITKETDVKIENLAMIVHKGFEFVEKKIDDFRIDVTQRLDHIEQVIRP